MAIDLATIRESAHQLMQIEAEYGESQRQTATIRSRLNLARKVFDKQCDDSGVEPDAMEKLLSA